MFGDQAYLMLTVVWQARDATLDELRQEIAQHHNIDDPTDVDLAFAPVQDVRCDLLLGDATGHFDVLERSTTSGVTPFSALFNLTLDPEQLAKVTGAIYGRSGLLAAEYRATLARPTTIGGRLVPQSGRLVPWLRQFLDADAAGFRAALEEAVADGLALVQVGPPEDPTGELVVALYDRLLTQATRVLPGMLAAWDENTLTDLVVATSFVHETTELLCLRLDFSELEFDIDRIVLIGGETPTPPDDQPAAQPETALMVGLDFDPTGAPLAWVRVRSDGDEVVLRPPDFGPAVLAATAVASISITAAYTDGTPTEKRWVRSSAGCIPPGLPGSAQIHSGHRGARLALSPDQLGLTVIQVDGRQLHADGARFAEVHLRFTPPTGTGARQESFRLGDGQWEGRWWLAGSRQVAVRSLTCRWTATVGEGHTVSRTIESPPSANIILSLQEDL